MAGVSLMTEFLNRTEIESRLARVLSKDLHGELSHLLDMLGDPPDLSKVPAEYWNNGWRGIQKDVEPILLDVFMTQAQAQMNTIGVGVDWALVNTHAVNWARDHSAALLRQLFDRTYEGVSTLVPEAFRQGWTMRELTTALERYYSPVRAEMIAITETTRAAVEGERAFVAQLEKDGGFQMVPVWVTDEDDRVCPICKPRDRKPITNGMFPPAHPNCRCYVDYEWPETLNKEQAELWQSR